MKRRVIQLVLLLVVGAIVNVAVAWGLAIGEPQQENNIEDVTPFASSIAFEYVAIPPDVDLYAVQSIGIGLSFKTLVLESNPSHILVVTEAGWPSRALRGGFHMVSAIAKPPITSTPDAIELSSRLRARNPLMPQVAFVLPLRPLWPGFAINTIFYAAILWVVFFVPGKLKRALRRKRGQCPACAYPVGSSLVCTECGRGL